MYCKTPGNSYKSYLLNILKLFTYNFFYAAFYCKQINSVKQRIKDYVMLLVCSQMDIFHWYTTRETVCECVHAHLP